MTRFNSLYWVPDLTCRFVHAKQRLIWIRITSLYRSQIAPHLSFFACKTTWLASELLVSKGARHSPMVLCIQNRVFMHHNCKVSMCSQPSSSGFVHSQQRHYAPELKVSMGPWPSLCWSVHATTAWHYASELHSLHGSQTSPVVLCMQNSVISIRITSLYGSQPSFVVFTSLYGSQTSPVDLWMQNSVLRSWMTLVYLSQPSSVVLCIQNSDFSIRITSLYGSQPSFVVLCNAKQRTLATELQFSMVPMHSPIALCVQNNVISTRITSLYGSQPSSVAFCLQNSDFLIRIT